MDKSIVMDKDNAALDLKASLDVSDSAIRKINYQIDELISKRESLKKLAVIVRKEKSMLSRISGARRILQLAEESGHPGITAGLRNAMLIRFGMRMMGEVNDG